MATPPKSGCVLDADAPSFQPPASSATVRTPFHVASYYDPFGWSGRYSTPTAPPPTTPPLTAVSYNSSPHDRLGSSSLFGSGSPPAMVVSRPRYVAFDLEFIKQGRSKQGPELPPWIVCASVVDVTSMTPYSYTAENNEDDDGGGGGGAGDSTPPTPPVAKVLQTLSSERKEERSDDSDNDSSAHTTMGPHAMSPATISSFIHELWDKYVQRGYTIITWGGTASDWKYLAMACDQRPVTLERIATMALHHHVDIPFSMLCAHGMMMSLERSALALFRVNPKSCSSADIPKLWTDPATRAMVVQHCEKDALYTLHVALAFTASGYATWLTRPKPRSTLIATTATASAMEMCDFSEQLMVRPIPVAVDKSGMRQLCTVAEVLRLSPTATAAASAQPRRKKHPSKPSRDPHCPEPSHKSREFHTAWLFKLQQDLHPGLDLTKTFEPVIAPPYHKKALHFQTTKPI